MAPLDFKPPSRVPGEANAGLLGGDEIDFEKEFEELSELGRGEFGVVFKARHRATGVLYAVKHIPQKFLEKGMTEVNVLRAMNHENIVSVQKFFKTSKELILVLELCEAGSLGAGLLKRQGGRRLGWSKECALLLQQFLSAVSHCHSQGFVHSDLKLDNLMFVSAPDEVPVLKVIDFGNARATSDQDPRARSDLEAEDMWFVGIIFFQLITGMPFFIFDPWERESLDEQGVYVDPHMMKCDSTYVELRMSVARRFADGMALDLLGKILTLNKASRITAKEALDHPFFLGIRQVMVTRSKGFCSRADSVSSVSTATSLTNDGHKPRL